MLPMMKAAKDQYEQAQTYTDFIRACGCVMATKTFHEAEAKAEALGFSDRVKLCIKAVQPGASTAGGASLFTAFMDSMRAIGAYENIADAALKVPLGLGRVLISSTVAASIVS